MTTMRRLISIVEGQAGGFFASDTILYHGTQRESSAREIIRDGLHPDQASQYMDKLVPIEGHVYLTPDPAEAIVYACGAYASNRPPDKTPLEPYGYVFVVRALDLNRILIPDEDAVGWFVRYRTNRNGKYQGSTADVRSDEVPSDSTQRSMWQFVWKIMTASERKTLLDNDEAMPGRLAEIGKRAIAQMPDNLKHAFIKLGVNVAHPGVVRPCGYWRLSKLDGYDARWSPARYLTNDTLTSLGK